jgi:hypothetical protein
VVDAVFMAHFERCTHRALHASSATQSRRRGVRRARAGAVAQTSMRGGMANVAGGRSACVAWRVSVTSDPSFAMWGVDEELRVSRFLSDSTDGEGHTVRHICTFVSP